MTNPQPFDKHIRYVQFADQLNAHLEELNGVKPADLSKILKSYPNRHLISNADEYIHTNRYPDDDFCKMYAAYTLLSRTHPSRANAIVSGDSLVELVLSLFRGLD